MVSSSSVPCSAIGMQMKGTMTTTKDFQKREADFSQDNPEEEEGGGAGGAGSAGGHSGDILAGEWDAKNEERYKNRLYVQ